MKRTRRKKKYFWRKMVIGTGVLAAVLLIYMISCLAADRDDREHQQTETDAVNVVATEAVTEAPSTEILTTEAPVTEVPTTEAPVTEEVTTEAVVVSEREAFFNNSLFIGDSRSAGLEQYADLGEADFFTGSGMSVYNIYKAKVIVEEAQKKSLEEMLSEKKYDTIYLMIGVNELGYNYEATVKRYTSLVEWLQEMEPEAEIVLQANLHMTREKSETDEIFNNPNINRFNNAVKELAEATGRDYLDVNPLFDDGEGNLSLDYAVDEAHILGKYYADWADWIYEERTKN